MLLKCSKCLEIKNESQFFRNSCYTRERSYYCKKCTMTARASKSTREYIRLYKSKNKDKVKKYSIKYNAQNIDKTLAQRKISNAFQHNKKRPMVFCFNCNQYIAKHFHHPDYNKPYEVIPLCITCHSKLHTNHIKIDNKQRMFVGKDFIVLPFWGKG